MSSDECPVAVDNFAFIVVCETEMDRMTARSFLSKAPETVCWLKTLYAFASRF